MSGARHLEVQGLAQLFKGLGDETRMRIVALLSHGELCVRHVMEALALTQPTVSRHLSVLRNAGIVQARRRGAWVYYQLCHQQDPARSAQVMALIEGFSTREQLRKDVKRLTRALGPDSGGPPSSSR